MSLINVSHLTFCYDGSFENIFEDVSFQLDTSWRLGFIGRNGRGKTTFLNLLMGRYEYSGEINACVSFEYFPYPVPEPGKNTLDIIYEINPEVELWRLKAELGRLSVDEDTLYRPFETLSNGERTKTLLSVLFSKENSFLLIDEPTNHLDAEAREKVSAYLKSKSGFILVSHDRAFLDGCIDHVLSINRADIEVQSGNFSSWYQNRTLKDSFELQQNTKLKKELKRLEESSRQKKSWSEATEKAKIGSHSADRGHIGRLSAKMMKRSKTIERHAEKSLEEKQSLLKNIELSANLKLSPLEHHAKRLIELNSVSIFYGEKTACRNVSFLLNQGDRLALLGRNGCGKSSILKLLTGAELAYSGEVFKAGGLKISYVRQDASDLSGNLEDFAARLEIELSLFLSILRQFGFQRAQFEKDMAAFSAGQKKKVLLAGSLCEKAHVYIWDEPLNYIDVLSRIQLEELIKEYSPTLLFVEHDRTFCENVATKSVRL